MNAAAFNLQNPGTSNGQHDPDICPRCGWRRSYLKQMHRETGIKLEEVTECPDCLEYFRDLALREKQIQERYGK